MTFTNLCRHLGDAMNAYDLSQMTDAQLYELQGRLMEELRTRRFEQRYSDQLRMQVGHYPPADKPPPQPVVNPY